MVEAKTAAQLREELSRAEWNEYLATRKAKQLERIALYEARIKEDSRILAEAKAKLAEIETLKNNGILGMVPKPAPGGVVVTPLPGTLDAKGL